MTQYGRWRGRRRMYSIRGFTMTETIVVLTIIGLMAVLTFALVGLDRSSRFDSQAQETLAQLRRMQSKARTAENNLEYGMSFGGSSWTTFSRDPGTGSQTNLETRNLEQIAVTTSFTPVASQVIFNRVTGATRNATSGSVTLANTVPPSRTAVIRVESDGRLYVQ